MPSAFAIPAGQVVIMFGLMALGFLAYRLGWIREPAVHGLTKVLLYFVAPAVVIEAFQRPFDLARLEQVGIVFAIDLAFFAITIGIARVLFSRRLVADEGRRLVLRFGTTYSNAGFIGIPLTQALYGDDGVTYIVAFIAAFTIFVWTHGDSLFATAGRLSVRDRTLEVLRNPSIIAMAVALLLFVLSWQLPFPLDALAGYLGAVNTPLSMLVVGASLASLSLRRVFTDRQVWLGTAARNLIIPLVFLGLLAPLPIDPVAKLTTMIAISAPVGAFLVMFSVLHERETAFATRLVCVSTVMSVVTLPAMLALAGSLW